jgi:glycosyltransferase involved in cell wall biosynthesis
MLEAYAASLPVIASDHGGLSELVNADQDGLVFRPGNVADLARVMQSILDDVGLNRRLQQGAQQRYVLDTEAEMQQLIGLYESAYAAADVVVSHV